MNESTGPPHQISNCGLSFSLRIRVSASPLDRRTKFAVIPGLAFSNSAFMPSHHSTCGVQSTLSSVLVTWLLPEDWPPLAGAWLQAASASATSRIPANRTARWFMSYSFVNDNTTAPEDYVETQTRGGIASPNRLCLGSQTLPFVGTDR